MKVAVHRAATIGRKRAMTKAPRDVEVFYSTHELVAKLRRLADALETNKPFRIQVAGERFQVPARARFSIEHERGEDDEEIEFQFTWPLQPEVDEEPVDESVETPVV
jgi:amphi-Trp domain-containing protein